MDEKLDELLGILARLAEDRGTQAEQARRLYRDELIPHLEADGARGFGQAVERIWQVSKRVPCNLRYWLFTPELQRDSRGKMANLIGVRIWQGERDFEALVTVEGARVESKVHPFDTGC